MSPLVNYRGSHYNIRNLPDPNNRAVPDSRLMSLAAEPAPI